MADPITLAWAGTPRADETQTNLGKVLTVPELKLVMMKSSKESENARRAAAAIPGATKGRVTRRKVCHSVAYKSRAASSSLGSKDAILALTVTTTNEIQNITWAITVVQKPGLIPKFKNIASKDAPRTISGVAIGRNINKLVVLLPRKL